jgi:hypothetical protein
MEKKEKTVYMQLKAISKQKKWPIAYKTDLTEIDREALPKYLPGDTLIWRLRECGTYLSYTNESFARMLLRDDPEIEYREFYRLLCANKEWVHAKHRSTKGFSYLIKIERREYGTVEPISDDKALELTNWSGERILGFYRTFLRLAVA